MQTKDKEPADDKRVAPSASAKASWSQSVRVIRLSTRRNPAERRRALAHEAERDPAGLAGWALAIDLWRRGDISAAYRLAQEVLRARPTDFQMLLICLDYHIRARDSTHVYAFAERLIAARNPAHQMRIVHAVLSLFLWPLWLLGLRSRHNFKNRVDNLDRWVSWAKNYVASHPRPVVAAGEALRASCAIFGLTGSSLTFFAARSTTPIQIRSFMTVAGPAPSPRRPRT
jgi:hypothetical protein